MFTNWVYKDYEQSDKVILELIPLSTSKRAAEYYSLGPLGNLLTRD
jgi:hypothetical protein